MSVRAKSHLAGILALAASFLALPGLALAGSGGAAPAKGGSSSSGAGVKPANVVVSASGNGITVQTVASEVLRRPTRFLGSVSRRDAGDLVEIQRRGRQTGFAWADTTHATVSSDGSFTATWPTNHIGRFAIRAVVLTGTAARAASASPSLTITVYRPSLATQYGPGFWGQRTACGEILHRNTLGVANRTLPCGTRVSILYQGRTLVVPVIDRGPYAHGADWDLTMATGRALGIPGTATIGAVSLRR